MGDMGLSAHHNPNLQFCTFHVAQNAQLQPMFYHESSWKETGIFLI